jgi:Carbohydrate family 9 binding domain-like
LGFGLGFGLRKRTVENQENQKSVVIAPYVADSIVSDLKNELWESCPAVQITQYWSGELAPSSRFAEVRLCWNEKALMVRFVGEQHEPLIVSEQPIVDRKTLGIWDRDVCEIFLAPDPNHPQKYFEFEVSPTGEWVDLGIVMTPSGRQTEWDYTSGITVAVEVGPKQIVVGMTIPWSDRIPRPKAADEWRTNLFRCIGSHEATRYMAWRPTYTPEPNFHVPDSFGVLRFT